MACEILALAVLAASLVLGCQAKQYTLNVPRVLLPYVPSSGIRANFTLRSQRGCFSWRSTKPDVASVHPVYVTGKNGLQCSREAVLTPRSTQPTRLSTIIIATEEATGLTLRSDVYVDTISRVEITTRTRELLLEEEPEKFEVRAFDDEGNMFSTVRGHIFQWTLLRDEEAKHQMLDPDAILDFVQFSDSLYMTDPIIGLLEEKDLQGDEVLVAGVNTGTARVQVRLADEEWKAVAPDIVKLLVIENLMLIPSADVYIMPLSSLDYRVERRKHGRTEVVTMPSAQYSLELTNESVASLDTKSSRVTGMVIGDTILILHDKNMLNIPQATKPSADIHVVFPYRIAFSLAPGNVWVLEVGRKYAITIHLLDKQNHHILITENVALQSDIPGDYLSSFFSSANGSYHHVEASKVGNTVLSASISVLRHPESGESHTLATALHKTQPVEIYLPIRVSPKELVVLLDAENGNRYQYQMSAAGGSGHYVWTCEQTDEVVGVSRKGMVTAVNLGTAVITVSDAKNPDHHDKALAYVVNPARLSFLGPAFVEVELEDSSLLPVQVLAQNPVTREMMPVVDCRNLQLNLTTSNQAIFQVSLSPHAELSRLPRGACGAVRVIAVLPGSTELTATNAAFSLSASTQISAFPPLVAVDPEAVAVVTIGSSKTVIFEGGPGPWLLDPVHFHKSLIAERPSDVTITTLPSPSISQHSYRVLCRHLGEQKITFSVGNGPSSKNPLPANRTTSVNMSCDVPVSLLVRPEVKQMPDCPLLRGGGKDIQFPVLSGSHLVLEVTVYDAQRRQFHNFSSLVFEWSSSDSSLLPLSGKASNVLAHHGNRAFLEVDLPSRSGLVVALASCHAYNKTVLQKEDVSVKDVTAFSLEYSLSLLLQSQPELKPTNLLLYNQPGNTATLNVLYGSAHFRVEHVVKPRPLVADVEYNRERRQIHLLPVTNGDVKVTVQDLCLPVDAVMATVTVGNIVSIQVKVVDKVQVGDSVLALVHLLDGNGSPFFSDQHHLMALQANPKTENIEIRRATSQDTVSLSEEQLLKSSVFVVKGLARGVAVLVFNSTSNTGHVVTSWPVEMQVFDPLRLVPREIILVPMATFQILSSGGPVHLTSMSYSIDKHKVATVDQSGLVTALTPGDAVVTGQAQSHDTSLGESQVLSSDVVKVKVVKLTGIKIIVPSSVLEAGVEVAVYAQGSGDETPFTFASAVPGLTFHWSTTNMDVITLASIYDKAGISVQEERDFSVRLRTANPGQGIIKLTAKCPQGVCSPDLATFVDQVHVKVFPPFRLLHPVDGRLLLPQNGHAKIVTNRDGISHLSYQLLRRCADEAGQQSLVTLGLNGEVRTAGFNGQAVVMVTARKPELGLNQTLVVHIEVSPIASLSLAPVSLARAMPQSKEYAFPLGYSAHFSARLHDSIGRQFDYGGVELSYRLSRLDIVHVTPGLGDDSYIVKAARQGNAILKVWVTDVPSISDYMRVKVDYAIIPSLATVHLGATVCFTTHLTEDKPGHWTSGNEAVITISRATGVAVAVSDGRAVVYHKVDGIVDTHTEISVARVHKVTFNYSSALPTFTNVGGKDLPPYRIHVYFLHEGGTGFSNLTTSPNKACPRSIVTLTKSQPPETTMTDEELYLQQVKFDCMLELKNLKSILPATKYIKSEAVFDPRVGASYCQLSPTEDPGVAEIMSVMQDLSLLLRVQASDLNATYQVWSESINIPIIPAFAVTGARQEVLLTQYEPSTEIELTGLSKQMSSIQVTNPYPISVTKSRLDRLSSVYLISLTDPQAPPHQNYTDLKVTFTSTLTQQELLLTVSYRYLTENATTLACPELLSSELFMGKLDETGFPDARLGKEGDKWSVVFLFVATVVVVLASVVVCLGLYRSSSSPQGGFKAHLPPTTPSQSPPAFNATSETSPATTSTPRFSFLSPSSSATQSAFRRPVTHTKRSPGHSSPHLSLFSQ